MANTDKVVTVPRLSRFLVKLKEIITPEWLGLGNVDNTSDASKHVAFASNANAAAKVNNNLVIRCKGGRTEGTDMWTYNGSAAKSINITAAKIGAVAVSQGASNAGKLLVVNDEGNVELIDLDTLRTRLNG